MVDNTNPSALERAKYVQPAKAAGFRVVGYYFESKVSAAIERNSVRAPNVKGTAGRLELPKLAEGFDELSYVRIQGDGTFLVDGWRDEV